MTKEDVDVTAVRNKFMEDRQKKIDAERANNQAAEERTEYGNGFNNPPAVRGTDGLPPSEPEQNPILMGAQADADQDNGDEDNADELTANSPVADIKAELDARGIDYKGVTKKADLFALLG